MFFHKICFRSQIFGAPAICAFLGLIQGCGPRPDTAPIYDKGMAFDAQAQRVIILSVDGLRPDALEPSKSVHFQSLGRAGAAAKTAQTVLPAVTLVSHASMLSGVSPEKHGISWNSYQPERGTITVPTIFDLAKKRGLKTAMIIGKEKLRQIARDGTVDELILQEGAPLEVANAAKEVIARARPELMFIHFSHPDSVGHEEGWMSSDQIDSIHQVDQAIGDIFYALKDSNLLETTAVIATADHGGSGKDHGSDTDASRRIPWVAAGAGIGEYGEVSRQVTTYDTAATAAQLLRLVIPSEWDGKSVLETIESSTSAIRQR